MENNNKNYLPLIEFSNGQSFLNISSINFKDTAKLEPVELQPMAEPNLAGHDEVPTAQYVTWAMLFLGWCITVFLYKRNKKNTQSQRTLDRHNTYVKEFKSLLFNVESSAIAFWTSEEEGTDQVKLLEFQRKIKELTAKAQEISNSGGSEYPAKHLMKLRKYVTLDNDRRPLAANASRIEELRGIVSELSLLYERKSDI